MRRPVAPEIVEAEQIGPGAQSHPQGARPAKPGEWVVTNHATATQSTMSNEDFMRDFMPLSVPAHVLAPEPGTGPEFQPQQEQQRGQAPGEQTPGEQTPEGYVPGDWTPQADQPAPPPPGGYGDQELSTPMNESLPGRSAPTIEERPRMEVGAPIDTNTGQPPGSPDAKPSALHSTEGPDRTGPVGEDTVEYEEEMPDEPAAPPPVKTPRPARTATPNAPSAGDAP
jgi:hypothetical protein